MEERLLRLNQELFVPAIEWSKNSLFSCYNLGIFNWHIYNVFIFQSWQNSNVTTPSPPEVNWCEERTACKWLVYGKNPHKKVELTIPTKTCNCSDAMDCIFSEDNLSMGAFVYRCLFKPTTETISPLNSWFASMRV